MTVENGGCRAEACMHVDYGGVRKGQDCVHARYSLLCIVLHCRTNSVINVM